MVAAKPLEVSHEEARGAMGEGQVATFTGEDVRFEIQRPGLGEGLGLVWGEEMVEACGDGSTLEGTVKLAAGNQKGAPRESKAATSCCARDWGRPSPRGAPRDKEVESRLTLLEPTEEDRVPMLRTPQGLVAAPRSMRPLP